MLNCDPDEVAVLAHCRRVSQKSKRYRDAAMQAFVASQPSTQAADEAKNAKTKAVLKVLVERIETIPDFIAQAVHGMRQARALPDDVHVVYANVVAQIEASEGLRASESIKRAVFSIMLEFRYT